MRRLVLGLISVAMLVNFVYIDPVQADNKSSKEKPVVVTIVTTTTTTITTLPYTGVTHEDMVKWSRVAICEMGGRWAYQGPIYSGGLGIRNTNWVAFGGTHYAPNAGLASPEEQVAIAKKINQGYEVPDQNGCGHGW